MVMVACQSEPGRELTSDAVQPIGADVVWAVNAGGAAYTGVDGTGYEADTSFHTGKTGRLESIKATQDPFLYQSYRYGNLTLERALDRGIYDLTFHFAEPGSSSGVVRVFDVLAEGQTVIDGLNVQRARDGQVGSALTVTVKDVAVDDGALDVALTAVTGEPVLSALVVRRPELGADDRQLVWRDEFEYDGAPDPEKWNIEVWPARKVNDEDQAYTGRPENLRVANGLLTIEARKEMYGGAQYTSARIHSMGKGDFLYGRIEVRARLPAGKGTWPAIWMLPSEPFRYATSCRRGEEWQGSRTCDAWPNSGEIDIMEHVGYEMGHVHGTVHTRAYYWVNYEQRKGRVLLDDVHRVFHVYALEWAPDRLDIFVDGTLYFTYMNDNDGWQSWPFAHPFHLVLNVAVGGSWGRAGGGIDDNVFPQLMEVDYVRVYAPASDW